MNDKAKKILKYILRGLFIALTVFSLWYWDRVLCIKDVDGTRQAEAMYYQPRNTVDVVMMGSSHIHCDIDTGMLWHDYGMAALDYSAAEQPLWITYHYLVEVCKYQQPKIVVLDLYSPALRKADYQYEWIRSNLCGMRFSLNKLQMLAACVEKDKLQEYFPDFAYYHDRFSTLTPEDLKYPFVMKKELVNFKGFTPYLNKEVLEEPVFEQDMSGDLTLKSEIYLQKIINYTRDHDIKLFLIVAPYQTNNSDELVYNRVKEIAEINDLEFQSMNFYYSDIGIDFNQDYNDPSHLNYWGAVKFTKYLGRELKKLYDIPDRRGDAAYDSWQANYLEIAEYVKNNT